MKLVLTGGPSGGKTTLAQTLQKEFASAVAIVPEAASIVFGGGWPRRRTPTGVEHQQKAIFFVQRELESLIHLENASRLLVCDRGSLDGVAYWPSELPSGGSEFLNSVSTTLETELSRYDWVIHLDTAPMSFYDLTNPLRSENFDEAWKLNEKVKEAWSQHPQRFVIDNREGGHFIDKMQRALLVVERIIQGHSYQDILQEMNHGF
jgi:predicted ATPase